MEETVPFQQSQAFVAVKRRFLNKKALRLIVIFIVLVLAVLSSYYFYNKYQKTQALLQNPNQASTTEAQVLVNNIGKLIELPANENPTIATVSDKTKLQDQPFFARAENGDKVLIFSGAKKAILYRPSTNKIIEVSVLNIEVNKQPAVSSSSASPGFAPTVTEEPIFTPSPTATQ